VHHRKPQEVYFLPYPTNARVGRARGMTGDNDWHKTFSAHVLAGALATVVRFSGNESAMRHVAAILDLPR
jgi:hypothetical protein